MNNFKTSKIISVIKNNQTSNMILDLQGKSSFIKNKIYSLGILLMCFVSFASLIGFLGDFHWTFDLFVHFKLQYLIFLTLVFILTSFIKWHKITLLFIIPILLNLIDVSSIYFGGKKNQSLKESISICSINVLSSNREFEKVKTLIRKEQPEILILQEVNTLWQTMLKKTLLPYSFRKEIIRDDNFGIAIYSKIPFESINELALGSANVPSINCKIKTKNSSINILATHPLPPIGKTYFECRNEQLEKLSKVILNSNENYVVIGDLNTSSYSNAFKNLIEKGNLVDSRKGFGIQASWPTWLPIVSFTIDHCLTTNNVFIKSRKVGQHIGSDHLPILVNVGLN